MDMLCELTYVCFGFSVLAGLCNDLQRLKRSGHA